MTLLLDETPATTPAVSTEPITEYVVAFRICDELEGACVLERALTFITWLRGAVSSALAHDGEYVFNAYEMGAYHDDLLEVVIPDDETAKPGSAHDGLQQLFGVELTHTKQTRTRACKLDAKVLRVAA